MDVFVKKLIKDNEIAFQSGNLSLFGFSNHLISLNALTTYFYILNLKYGNSVKEIIKETGRKQAKALYEVLFGNLHLDIQKIELFLRYFSVFGYGSIKLVKVNSKYKEITFEVVNSPLCRMQIKLFGYQARGTNDFVVGLCQGVAEILFNHEMNSEEIECIALHKDRCYIKAKRTSNKEPESILIQYIPDILTRMKKRILLNFNTELIKKILGHNVIEWKDGMFSVWSIPGYIFPSPSLIFLNKALEEKFGSEVNSIFYNVGKAQSKNAVQVQVKNYGFKKEKKLLLSVLEHSELSGFGITSLGNSDFKNKIIAIKQKFNPYPIYYKDIVGKASSGVDHYMTGLLAGLAEGFFEIPMEARETKCVGKGDEYCCFESVEGNKKHNYQLEDKYLKILEEKINLRNLVL